MAKNKEYQDGYAAAIEAIKAQLNGNNDSSSGSSGDSGLPDDMTPPSSVAGSGNNQQSGSNSQDSRTDSNNANQGIVRPEDCIGPSGLNNTPGTAGGMISQNDGNEICKKEGYEESKGSEEGNSKEWGQSAMKQIGSMKGNWSSVINSIYKVKSDWKKELRKIVGHSISPDDKRSAYANKNVLVSQDRLARTDKDKYDNLDYMMAWIDSSGSMSDDQLRQCLSEVYAVALAKKPIKLVVVQCDTVVQDIQVFRNIAELKKYANNATVKGRGGTDFKACWDLLNEKPYKGRPAELVMLFTDGECSQYKRNPRTMNNLCWVILDNPSFNLQYKDTHTKCVHIKTADIK